VNAATPTMSLTDLDFALVLIASGDLDAQIEATERVKELFAARDAALQAAEERVRTLEAAVSAMLKCDCSYFQGEKNATSEIRELARAALAVTPAPQPLTNQED
jgi:hypothetical protein